MYNCCAISIHVSEFRDLWRHWASDKEQRLSKGTLEKYEVHLFGSTTEGSRHESFAAMLEQQGTPLHIFFYNNGYDSLLGYDRRKGSGRIGFPPTEAWKEFAKIPGSPSINQQRCYAVISLLKFLLVQQGRYLIRPEETSQVLTFERRVNGLRTEIKNLALGYGDDVVKEGKEKKARETVLDPGLREELKESYIRLYTTELDSLDDRINAMLDMQEEGKVVKDSEFKMISDLLGILMGIHDGNRNQAYEKTARVDLLTLTPLNDRESYYKVFFTI